MDEGITDNSIDRALLSSFREERIIRAFYDQKVSKWDHFSGLDEPEINIAMGADGISFQAFEKQLYRNAKNICRRIHSNSYIFYPLRELDIQKEPPSQGKPAKFRTLSIASIRDTLVQDILYSDVLYESLESLFIKLDAIGPVSFSYRKGKSAPKAAIAIENYIKRGYQYVLDADLSKYFDTIPHDRLMAKLEQVVGSSNVRTLNLVRRFIHTDRVPYLSYKYAYRNGKLVGYKVFHWQKPQRKKRVAGVPQGGVLSGMLANLYLQDFDQWVVSDLGKSIDLKYVRYADDFIILLRSPDKISFIRQEVKKQIEALDLKLNDDKTIEVEICKQGLDFVGFHFNGQIVSVKSKNIEKFKETIEKVIQNPPSKVAEDNDPQTTLMWLVRRIRYKIQGFSGKEICPMCGCEKIGYPRSWMAFFQVVTNDKQLKELDKWLRQLIYQYMYEKHHVRVSRKILNSLGLKTLLNEKYSIPTMRIKPCLCEIQEKGLWHFTSDLFANKNFHTLARGCPFLVDGVNDTGISTKVGGRQYIITRNTFLQLWDNLRTKGRISRLEIERMGITSTSQIVSLLSEISGVVVTGPPITLYFQGYHPASFVTPPPK